MLAWPSNTVGSIGMSKKQEARLHYIIYNFLISQEIIATLDNSGRTETVLILFSSLYVTLCLKLLHRTQ